MLRLRLRRLVESGLAVVAGAALASAVPSVARAALPWPIAEATAVGPNGGELIQSPEVIGRDQGASAPLDGIFPGMRGRSAWIFGDTILSANSPGADCDHLAVDTQAYSGRDASNGIRVGLDSADATGAPTEFLPPTPVEARYDAAHHTVEHAPCAEVQPPSICAYTVYGRCDAEYVLNAGALVTDPSRQRLLSFFDVSWRLRNPPDNLSSADSSLTIGAGMASWSPNQRPELRRLYFTRNASSTRPSPYAFGNGRPPSNDPDPGSGVNYTGPQYAEAPVIPPHQTRYLYLYDTTPASQQPDCGLVYCYKTKLARVPLATLTDVSTWRFFDANEPTNHWERSSPNATYLRSTGSSHVASAGPADFSVTYNPYLREYVMFYQRVLTQTIGYRTAATPWGPWSSQGIVPFREVTPGPGGLTYAAQAHDEFSQQHGKIMYLTYVASGAPGGVYAVKVVFR